MNLKPLTGARSMSSIRNICHLPHLFSGAFAALAAFQGSDFAEFGALKLETNVNEIVRGPRTCVLERQLAFVLGSDLFHLLIKLRLSITLDKKSGVHDHAVADRFVSA